MLYDLKVRSLCASSRPGCGQTPSQELKMPFGKGSRGPGVQMLQQALDSWIKNANATGQNTGLIGVVADGSFGQNTSVALATYQKWVGLSPSGFADEGTLSSLELSESLDADGSSTASGGGI